jgi:hypothetical protein
MAKDKTNPASITMIFDLDVAKKASQNIPENIKQIYPEIISSMAEAYKSQSKFFGFAVITGDKPESFSGFAKGLDSVGLLIHSLCEYTVNFGSSSQWLVVSDKKTKKILIPMINKTSSAFTPVSTDRSIPNEAETNESKKEKMVD